MKQLKEDFAGDIVHCSWAVRIHTDRKSRQKMPGVAVAVAHIPDLVDHNPILLPAAEVLGSDSLFAARGGDSGMLTA